MSGTMRIKHSAHSGPNRQAMPVLTLHQPYATLIALGVKWIETRSWSTKVRGRIAIHAAVKRPKDYWCSGTRDPDFPAHLAPLYDYDKCVDLQESNDGEWWRYRWAGPLGAIVATADLVDCVPMVPREGGEPPINAVELWGTKRAYLVRDAHRIDGATDVSDQLPYGDFTPGRFAWLLEGVEPLDEPVPFRGGQGWSRTWEPTT